MTAVQEQDPQPESLPTYFRLFSTGQIINPLPRNITETIGGKEASFSHARVQIPTRLNTCVARLDKIITPPRPGVIPAASINFTANCMTEAEVDLWGDEQVVVQKPIGQRAEIVKHDL